MPAQRCHCNTTFILLTLGLHSVSLKPTVGMVKQPKFIQIGMDFVAKATRLPPLQALVQCEAAVKHLTRFVEKNIKPIQGKCPHGFDTTYPHGRHCIGVNALKVSGIIKLVSHMKRFSRYQQTLYQRLCEVTKSVHQSDRSIDLGKHVIAISTELDDQEGILKAQRIISLAYASKKATLGPGSRSNMASWEMERESLKWRASSSCNASLLQQEEFYHGTQAGDAADEARLMEEINAKNVRLELEAKKKKQEILKKTGADRPAEEVEEEEIDEEASD
ncbi:hypothetical protein CYMTET_42750 [Cymbomonas tetramitiformis]|uniref:Uncharacterized protein n=1 Tax=Cymbomonas tetramitiformis TaxID=36881 RepID=A0AAE0C4X0_9CHLO|nr:hypothetical protein CYMTET_42750 [Cymbomonas tetramitiformis]